MRRALLLILVTLVMLIATPANAETKDVQIQSLAYNPASVTVDEGDSVRWTNNDGTGHSVTADDGSFDSSGDDCSSNPVSTQESCIKPDSPFVHAFDTAGTYAYHCRVHASMHGTVVVMAAATTTTASTTTTTTNPTTTTTASSSTTTSTSSTTTTSSSTTTTSTTVRSSASGQVAIQDKGGSGGGSSALPLLLGAFVVVAGLAGLAYWLWLRSGEPYEDDGPDWTQEPPPTVQGPRI